MSLGDLQFANFRLARRESLKILGLTFSSNLSWSTHVVDAHSKASRALGAILAWGNRRWGFKVTQQRLLYLVGVMPVMLYASAVWFKPGRSKQLIKPLVTLQRTAATRITGCYKSTSTEALDFEASLLPLDLAICQQAGRDLVRLLTVPAAHPARKTVDRVLRVQPQAHEGSLHAWI